MEIRRSRDVNGEEIRIIQSETYTAMINMRRFSKKIIVGRKDEWEFVGLKERTCRSEMGANEMAE